MACTEDIAAALDHVDALLVVAKETAPSVALLLDIAAAHGIGEKTLATHLRLNATVLKWIMRLAPDATTDRRIELEAADVDLAELLRKWARHHASNQIWFFMIEHLPYIGFG
jgi:hypothetical protein